MFRSLSTAWLLLLLALPAVALAQGTGTLAGRVVDAQTGETLIGANVRIEGTSLGAATNIDGEYRSIGVPVGTYSVTASYTGYQSVTVEDVAINNGYTRELNFELSNESLGEVVVEYERPIIQRDAIGTPRVVSSEDLENLPIRSVAGVTALQGGVVSTDNSSALNIRGGRSEEVAYYVDGVRVTGLLGINQQAIQEQEVLIGTIPARYGDVQSGVISITTKTGRQDFFGSGEFITSQGLDSFGYNVASLSLGGPILIGELAAQAGEAGIEPFLRMMALISINLAIFNLVPIPVLDGGQLTLFAMEAVKRGPLSYRTRQIAAYIGFTLIVMLMLLAFKNDIERNWDRIVETIQG